MSTDDDAVTIFGLPASLWENPYEKQLRGEGIPLGEGDDDPHWMEFKEAVRAGTIPPPYKCLQFDVGEGMKQVYDLFGRLMGTSFKFNDMKPLRLKRFMRHIGTLWQRQGTEDMFTNHLGAFFSDPVRYRASALRVGSTKESFCPMTAWVTNIGKFVHTVRKWSRRNRTTVGSNDFSRELFYGSAACSLFRPLVAKSIYDKFEAHHVLDMSAGWGDRLIGALACRTVRSYTGIDPNPLMHTVYQNIQRAFNISMTRGTDTVSVHTICAPFEDAELPERHRYDLAFTSPPFFNRETYDANPATNAAQSLTRYPGFDAWVTKFLWVLIAKTARVLKSGGHLVLAMADFMGHPFCESTIGWVGRHQETLGLKAIGVMAFGVKARDADKQKHPQPIYVWRKL